MWFLRKILDRKRMPRLVVTSQYEDGSPKTILTNGHGTTLVLYKSTIWPKLGYEFRVWGHYFDFVDDQEKSFSKVLTHEKEAWDYFEKMKSEYPQSQLNIDQHTIKNLEFYR